MGWGVGQPRVDWVSPPPSQGAAAGGPIFESAVDQSEALLSLPSCAIPPQAPERLGPNESGTQMLSVECLQPFLNPPKFLVVASLLTSQAREIGGGGLA